MNRDMILNILSTLVLIIGIVNIIIASFKPAKLVKLDNYKLNGRTYTIKDKPGFIKHNQKVYALFGIICSIISIITLLKIGDFTFFAVGVSFTVAFLGLINSISIKKFA
ncbi:hypothetical protein [Clostridium manihotivorum]|uniref:DUF3784 domain-containing protein n=1 Tax=Clostridium manihotivorum TaxID=2320868 RepID=A0A410DSY5_9CLOT|nr:hypothetical protein [Clostridium manihotivorum]QAA32151.1 hypothetical protein C1I91_11080 [Clostridium manihotivorum]